MTRTLADVKRHLKSSPSQKSLDNNKENLWAKVVALNTDTVCSKPAVVSLSSASDAAASAVATTDRVRAPNALDRYSLRGRGAELAERAQEVKPLLGSFIMSGQATIIYAAPGTGKTLITTRLAMDAILDGRIDADNVYYVNADDNSSGLALKTSLLEELGAHTIAPGELGFDTSSLAIALLDMAEADQARGVLIVIDTLKKFADLMDKKLSSQFGQICRLFVAKGGTVVTLAHTTKNANPDGTPRYSGTTDFREDFDAMYVIKPLAGQADAGHRVVQFDAIKNRAVDSPDTVAFTYSVERGVSYEEKLASVEPVDPDQLDAFKEVARQVDDAAVIEGIKRLITDGAGTGLVALVKATAKAAGVSRREAQRVLDRYTAGSDCTEPYWAYRKGDRGVRQYIILRRSEPGEREAVTDLAE